ncbi:MAG: Pr6Pr family membrane protein [Ktedonobacteraceae bacterium]
MPVVMVLDWLYQPPKTKLVVTQTWIWLIFPVLYLVYSLIRGSIVGWPRTEIRVKIGHRGNR